MAANISSTSPSNAMAYINGRVYTVNSSQPWAEAFIVSPTGTFSAVGSTATILELARKDNLITYDLRNQFIMPGIHDAHLHLLMAGLSRLSTANLGLSSVIPASSAASQLQESACMCSYAHAFSDWLVGDIYQIEDYDRSALDETYPTTPVMIRAGAGHSMYLNTEALTRSGYDIDSEPPSKASVLIRRPSGSLTGEVAELGMTKALLAYPKPPLSHIKRALKHAIHLLHQSGITSCQDASSNTLLMHALRDLDAIHALQCNVFTHIVYAPEIIGEEPLPSLHSLISRAKEFESEHVHTNFIKMMLDGVPLAPYYTHAGLTENGEVDETKIFLDEVFDAVRKCDEQGLTCKIHCTGQGSTRRALDAFEAVRKSNPNGPRHEVAHCSGVHDDEFPRFRHLNITAEMSPSMFFSHPLTAASNGLMHWNFPALLSSEAHMTIGSDWGVPASPSPFPACAGIVDAVGGGDRVKGGEMLCRILTLSGAEAVGREGAQGSIEVGKRADFISVDRDLARGEFEGARVLGTWFGGERVWEAPREGVKEEEG